MLRSAGSTEVVAEHAFVSGDVVTAEAELRWKSFMLGPKGSKSFFLNKNKRDPKYFFEANYKVCRKIGNSRPFEACLGAKLKS